MTAKPITRPATFPGTASAASAICQGLCQIARNLHRRMQIRASMGGLSERQLRDIGLTRSELDLASAAPLSQDASKVLAGARRSRPVDW